MLSRTVIVLFALAISTSCYAQAYNFDDLSKGSGESINQTTVAPESRDMSQKALERQKDRYTIEEAARERAANAASAKYRTERALGNGSRFYACEFACEAKDGLPLIGSYDSTNKISQVVKADENWMAENIVKENAKELCSKIKGLNTNMYLSLSGSVRCKEKK